MNLLKELDISIDHDSSVTKVQQLINELIRAINTKLDKGDILPSINTLSKDLGISRDTVFKAYNELRKRQIVDSTPTKGYYVSKEMNKVLIFLDFYSPFKDIVYREIESILGSAYSIDLIFHHYNFNLFENIILESIGRYNFYIVMNFDTQDFAICDVLKKIEPSKLLLLDIPIANWKDFEKKKYNYLWQDFDQAVYESLDSILPDLKKYRNFQIIYPSKLKHPAITLKAYVLFCHNNIIQSGIIHTSNDLDVKRGDAYFALRQHDLTVILSQCKEKKLEVGKDVGIIAYNDSLLYEFVSNGITVITTNFKEMGRKAALFIMEGRMVKETIPTAVIHRNSI